jgi:hypothetical protein
LILAQGWRQAGIADYQKGHCSARPAGRSGAGELFFGGADLDLVGIAGLLCGSGLGEVEKFGEVEEDVEVEIFSDFVTGNGV